MSPPHIQSPAPSAGYGRSCTNCSRAKCKCILRADGTTCERCHRLRKDCQPMVSSRKRAVKKSSSSRTAQLEEKLDDLVSILRASQTQPTGQNAVSNELAPQPDRAMSTPASATPTEPRQYPSRLESLATAATSSSTASPAFRLPAIQYTMGGAFDSHPSDRSQEPYFQEPSPHEANARLNKFRMWLTNFPFLYLPEDMRAEDLRRDKPVLYSVIMDITSMSVPEQQAMSDGIRKDVLRRIYFENERTLDLVYALIALLAWAHFNSASNHRSFIIPYTQLAITLVFDLGLNKSIKEEQYFIACFKVYGPSKVWPTRPPSRPRTMDERRAVLAVWFLSSQFATLVGKIDTLKWTRYMEECLEILERTPEIPSDETLAVLVHLQKIYDEAQELLVRDAVAEPDSVPTYVFRKGLRDRFNSVKTKTRPGLIANSFVQAHFHATEIQLECVGLFADSDMPEAQRIEGMYTTVKAVRAWYDLFLTMHALDMPGMPFMFFMHFTQTQVVLYKLTVSNQPGWDKSILRSTADPTVYLDRSVERFQELNAAYPMKPSQEAPSVFAKGVTMVSHIKSTWEPTLMQHLGGLPTPESQGAANTAMGMTPNISTDLTAGMVDPSMWDFGDIGWMTDVFGPWEF